MFNHLTKKQIVGQNGCFEVYHKESGELIGAVFRDMSTPKQISEKDFKTPYEVYYKGEFICSETASPRAMLVISDLYKNEMKQKRGLKPPFVI